MLASTRRCCAKFESLRWSLEARMVMCSLVCLSRGQLFGVKRESLEWELTAKGLSSLN
jgi:hypothetical protein